MGKIGKLLSHRLREYAKVYNKSNGTGTFTTDGEVFRCNVCDINISVRQKSQIDQHLAPHLIDVN